MTSKKCKLRIGMVPMLLPIGLGVASGANAASDLALADQRFKANLGAFFADLRSGAAVEVHEDDGSRNAFVDLEDDLGLDTTETVFRVDGWWRFAPRHRLLAGYYSFDRTSSKILEKDIEWEDSIFLKGSKAKLDFEWQLVPVSYAYSFYRKNGWEVSGSLGIHWIELDVAVSGTVEEATGGTASRKESSSVAGPLPNLGLHVDYQPNSDWILGGLIQYFSLEHGKYDGTMLDAGVYAEYLLSRNWGVGLGYNFFDIDVDVDTDDWDGTVDLEYGGLQAYVSARF